MTKSPELVAIDRQVIDAHPDAVCYEVVGDCMRPEISGGQLAIVSPSAPVTDGCMAAFDVGRSMPRLGKVTKIVGEFVKACDGHGGEWAAPMNQVLGVVVGVA